MVGSGPLRIAIVAPYDLSRPGGVNNQIRAQARALERLGHTVQVCGAASGPVAPGEVPLGAAARVTLFGTESGFGVDPRAFGRIGGLLRQPIDLLHVHEPFMPVVPWIAVARAHVPIAGTFHVHREEGHRLYSALGWMLQPLSRRLDVRIAVSDAARRTVAPHFPGRYEILPNGIDVQSFRTPRPRPAIFERGRRHVLYVGRLEPRKGVAHLVRAMAGVQRRAASPPRLVVAGSGPDETELRRLASASGVDVRFAGRVSDDELPGFLQAAEIVCAPATGGESFGIVLLEAMAACRPLIASGIEGYRELVGDSGGARLVPPANPDALAAAISELLADEGARASLAAAGAAVVRSYDWNANAERLVALYYDAIGRRAAEVS